MPRYHQKHVTKPEDKKDENRLMSLEKAVHQKKHLSQDLTHLPHKKDLNKGK